MYDLNNSENTNYFTEELARQLLNSTDPFPVEFDLLWQWVGYSNKSDAKSNLTNNFQRDSDFSGDLLKTPFGGRPSEYIKTTVNCAKKFALLAKTIQGDTVRDLFIAAEDRDRAMQSLIKSDPILQVRFQQIEMELRIKAQEQKQLESELRIKAQEQKQLESEKKLKLVESKVEEVDSFHKETMSIREIQLQANAHGYYTVFGFLNQWKLCYSPKTGTVVDKLFSVYKEECTPDLIELYRALRCGRFANDYGKSLAQKISNYAKKKDVVIPEWIQNAVPSGANTGKYYPFSLLEQIHKTNYLDYYHHWKMNDDNNKALDKSMRLTKKTDELI